MTQLSDVIQYGLSEVGKPYVYGSDGPTSFDCSGLIQYVFGKIGVSLPRTAAQQQNYATPVASPQAGDLVFWGAPAYHVAMYVGGGKVLSAPHSGADVRVQDLWGTPTFGRVNGVGGSSTIIATAYGAIQPVASMTDDVIASIGSFGRMILFVGAGAVLVILGAYRTVKGSGS